RVKNYYPNSFSNHRIYNSGNSGYDSTPNYWSKLLTFSKAPTLAELQSKDFTLMTPDGIFLNYYLGPFQITFDSFSHELNGTLYLQVTLTSKTNPPNVITKVFQATRFK
ncbi:MAG1430 family protein, partial [Mycoplasmopsis synoviae]